MSVVRGNCWAIVQYYGITKGKPLTNILDPSSLQGLMMDIEVFCMGSFRFGEIPIQQILQLHIAYFLQSDASEENYNSNWHLLIFPIRTLTFYSQMVAFSHVSWIYAVLLTLNRNNMQCRRLFDWNLLFLRQKQKHY